MLLRIRIWCSDEQRNRVFARRIYRANGTTPQQQILRENLEYEKHLINQFVEGLFNQAHVLITWDRSNSNIGVNPCYAIQNHFRESLSGKLDRQMQELIVCEVLDFLHSKSSRPLAEKLFIVASSDLVYTLADGINLGFTALMVLI